MSMTRLKKIERNKLHALSPHQLKEVRERTLAERESTRRRRRQNQATRSQWGQNTYVDDCFVSKMLVKWTFARLLDVSHLLVTLLNRRRYCTGGNGQQSEVPGPLPRSVASLVYYRYSCEYYETLFADYTLIEYDDQQVSFRAYYTTVYREAYEFLRSGVQDLARRDHLFCLLRACFLIALVYEPRIRRYVFSNHDLHYKYYETHPPPRHKAFTYIDQVLQPLVNQFLGHELPIDVMVVSAIESWIQDYMFLLE